MSEKRIYVEGGDSKELQTRCREGFRKLLENAGLSGRVPRIVACGSRNDAFDAFQTAHTDGRYDSVVLIVDSEDPVSDGEKPWDHLAERDGWKRPAAVTDTQVFLMTTCMETWLVADRSTLQQHYGSRLQVSALPAVADLEVRRRHDVQDALIHATRHCTNAYAKNKRSFALLAIVDPQTLQKHLPAFARMLRILSERL